MGSTCCSNDTNEQKTKPKSKKIPLFQHSEETPIDVEYSISSTTSKRSNPIERLKDGSVFDISVGTSPHGSSIQDEMIFDIFNQDYSCLKTNYTRPGEEIMLTKTDNGQFDKLFFKYNHVRVLEIVLD